MSRSFPGIPGQTTFLQLYLSAFFPFLSFPSVRGLSSGTWVLLKSPRTLQLQPTLLGRLSSLLLSYSSAKENTIDNAATILFVPWLPPRMNPPTCRSQMDECLGVLCKCIFVMDVPLVVSQREEKTTYDADVTPSFTFVTNCQHLYSALEHIFSLYKTNTRWESSLWSGFQKSYLLIGIK